MQNLVASSVFATKSRVFSAFPLTRVADVKKALGEEGLAGTDVNVHA